MTINFDDGQNPANHISLDEISRVIEASDLNHTIDKFQGALLSKNFWVSL